MSVTLKVGNTYQRLPEEQAPLDRSGSFPKVHDWILFVDILSGPLDSIKRVEFDLGSTFEPSVFPHFTPVYQSSSGCWRFSTHQQTFAMGLTFEIRIVGAGGTVLKIPYQISSRSSSAGARSRDYTFRERHAYKPLGPVPLSIKRTPTFGLELELTTARHASPESVATQLSSLSGIRVHVMTDDYHGARQEYSEWKLMGDSSIQCHVNRPDCHAFELVSPILEGEDGLDECRRILFAMKKIRTVRVNKSMGFHVHVGVESLSLARLIKVSQNFIKYEEAMDAFMPWSRRANSYCLSNRDAVLGVTNKEKHDNLAACRTVDQLVDKMNPQGRYYKLNMQNLKTGRLPTIEFRQHSATVSQEKITNWVRFCVWLVYNSQHLHSPSALRGNRTVEEKHSLLFQHAIKDRYLGLYFHERKNEIGDDPSSSDCCSNCKIGGTCEVRPNKSARY